jgi:hypothetical protein
MKPQIETYLGPKPKLDLLETLVYLNIIGTEEAPALSKPEIMQKYGMIYPVFDSIMSKIYQKAGVICTDLPQFDVQCINPENLELTTFPQDLAYNPWNKKYIPLSNIPILISEQQLIKKYLQDPNTQFNQEETEVLSNWTSYFGIELAQIESILDGKFVGIDIYNCSTLIIDLYKTRVAMSLLKN